MCGREGLDDPQAEQEVFLADQAVEQDHGIKAPTHGLERGWFGMGTANGGVAVLDAIAWVH